MRPICCNFSVCVIIIIIVIIITGKTALMLSQIQAVPDRPYGGLILQTI
jgi:putative copper export protein